MRKMMTWLLVLALLLGCMPAMAENVIDLTYSRYEVSDQVAVVTVTDTVINDVKAGIFGANTSYRGGGYGLYNEETLTFNETLVQQLRDSGVTVLRLPGGIEGD